jgi:hypothetical protein
MADRKAELLNQLSILQRKEEEVANMIMALDTNFRELGYQVDSTVDVTKKRLLPQTGIRIKGELSFRGKEKAAEYFDCIDADHDNQLNYEDFRGTSYTAAKYTSCLLFQLLFCSGAGIWRAPCGLRGRSRSSDKVLPTA